MRIVPVDKLKPGQQIGRVLMDETGRVLLNKGVRLTESYIAILRGKCYRQVCIQDAHEGDIEVECEEDLSPALRSFALHTIRTAFQDIEKELDVLRDASLDDVAKVCSSDHIQALMGTTGPLASVHEVVSQILNEVMTRSTLAGLTSIKGQDARLFDHSIDVCVVAIMIGHTVHLRGAHLNELATGCLLHDIGMLFVRRGLDERQRIRHHTKLGYELLRSSPNPDLMAPHVAYEHHEHQDGTGLPRGLKSTNTLRRERGGGTPVPALIGEIAAVANVYDNLLSGDEHRPPMAPDEALAEMGRQAGTILNREVVSSFRRVVPVYPRGTQVVLRGEPYNNFLGIVSRVDPDHLDRPAVILVRDGRRKRITPTEIQTGALPKVQLHSVGI